MKWLFLFFTASALAGDTFFRPVIPPLNSAGSPSGISFIAAEGTDITSSLTSPNVAYPAGIAANDILLAIFSTDGAHDSSGTPPTGWNKIDEMDETGGDTTTSVFWKRAVGGDPVSETWTSIFAAGEQGKCITMIYRGCKTSGSPINTYLKESSPNGTAHDITEVTTTANNCLLLGVIGGDPGASTTRIFTWDGGITERIGRDTTPSGNNAALGWISVGEKLLATAGASGTLGGDTDASDTAAEFLIALEPQ